MNIEVEKSYRLLRFINKPRPRIVRFLYGISAWVSLLVLGAPLGVATDSFRLAMDPNGIKIVIRRLIWFANASWLPVSIRSDYFFDISEKLGSNGCRALIAWLENNSRIDEFDRSIWLAELHGGILERECERHGELVIRNGDPMKQDDDNFITRLNESLKVLSKKIVYGSSSQEKIKKFNKAGGSFDKADAYEAIADFRTLMETLEWPWYVVSGTFLGAVREQDFLGHDYDIDVGVDEEYFSFSMLKEKVSASDEWFIKAANYCTFREKSDENFVRYYQLEQPILVKLVHKSGLVADLFVHIKEGDVVWHGSPIHRWDNSAFDLAVYQLGHETVLGAKDADRYLTENYGDWRTPVYQFDCSIDPPNIRYSRTARSVTYLCKVAYRLFLDGETAKAQRYLTSLEAAGVVIRSESGFRFNG